jgi:hypothetical protein
VGGSLGHEPLPFPRNQFFAGRTELLERITGAFLKSDRSGASRVQVLCGLGGIGKTQTIVEYIYLHERDYRVIQWADADSVASLDSSYRELCCSLRIPLGGSTDADEVRAKVRKWLSGESGYLLVLDNADDPATVRAYLPVNPRGHILLSSRAHNFDILQIVRGQDNRREIGSS